MYTLQGNSILEEICIGRLFFYERTKYDVEPMTIHNVDAEIKRFELAKETAILELESLYKLSLEEEFKENADMFQGHQMILEDEGFYNYIIDLILYEEVNAEYAVNETAKKYSNMFLAMSDDYMKGKAIDIIDVTERLLRILYGDKSNELLIKEPVILATDDLRPSEVMNLDKKLILGFAMGEGSKYSHTAILARALEIPAILGIGMDLKKEYNGKLAIIDGIHGILYIDPEKEILDNMRKLQQELIAKKEMLLLLKNKDNVTLDGRRINIFANINQGTDVTDALLNDAGGIGLFRSEFLYLNKDTYPSEEEQFAFYKDIIKAMNGKKVIIRTLDIGSDKTVDYFGLGKEENPAMGYRAIRICLTDTQVFKTQLRAILRASLYGCVSIMFPMIISAWEVKKAKDILEEVKDELKSEGIDIKEDIEVGIMIETPAAVMVSDELAKEVDFFSVGTNDLTQYTLAIDRQNRNLEAFFDPHHPAILKMLEMVANNAHANGIWVGICGELAADLSLTKRFLQMGYDELSVPPSMILPLRKQVRELDLS